MADPGQGGSQSKKGQGEQHSKVAFGAQRREKEEAHLAQSLTQPLLGVGNGVEDSRETGRFCRTLMGLGPKQSPGFQKTLQQEINILAVRLGHALLLSQRLRQLK